MQDKVKVVVGGLIAFLTTAMMVLLNMGSETTSALGGPEVNFNLVNGIYIRILDKTATQPIDNIELNTTATRAGVFVSDNFIVDVGTANKTGYNLYVSAGYQTDPEDETTRTTDLVHQENTSYRIATLGADISLADFNDGGDDESGVSSANRWGLSVDNTTYKPLSLDSTEIDSLSEPTASRQTPVYVGLNVNLDSAAGAYKNTLVFSAVGNAVPTQYKVAFASGATDTVSAMPEDITLSEVSAQHTFTLPTTAPTRSGYDFTGWKDDASGTVYQAGGEFTVASDEYYEGNAALTAQWMVDPWKNISTMQAMTTTACNNAVIGKTKSLRDTRDSNKYKYYSVRKLADGKCWMRTNLALEGSITLTSSDSDVMANFTLPAADTGTWCAQKTAACINQSLVHKDGTTYYYNWYAATAGSGNFSTAAEASVNQSICPKGWKLPTSKQISVILEKYTDRKELINQLNLTRFGNWNYYVYGNKFTLSTYFSYIWSNTLKYSLVDSKYPLDDLLNLSYSAYVLEYSPSASTPYWLMSSSTEHLYQGVAIRCIK